MFKRLKKELQINVEEKEIRAALLEGNNTLTVAVFGLKSAVDHQKLRSYHN